MSLAEFQKLLKIFDIEEEAEVESEMFAPVAGSQDESKIDYQGFWRTLYKVMEKKHPDQKNVRFISAQIIKKLVLDDL